MHIAAATAEAAGKPIVLDPVGVGATTLRNKTAAALLQQYKPKIVRGNASEIKALAGEAATTKGVDATDTTEAALDAARSIAAATGGAVVVSGATDYIVSNGGEVALQNGHSLMAKVTGMGCTASALCGAFAAVVPSPAEAAFAAMAVMGVAGEIAAEKAAGPGSLQLHLLDCLYNLIADQLVERLKIA